MSIDAIENILSRFSPVELIDEGGQKRVYKITHPDHGVCVLKTIQSASSQMLQRIVREVELLRILDSRFFPDQYDFQLLNGDSCYIIEEFIAGCTLDQAYARFSTEKAAVDLIAVIVQAVSLLWNHPTHRTVHRDLKPRNIMISAHGPRILDLGIARILDRSSLTLSVAPYGPCTPNYASIEQLQNRKTEIDFRCDQFTIGILLAQLILGGNHPFSPEVSGCGGSIPENIMSGAWARQPVQESVSDATFALVERMLGKEPYQRFRRITELVATVQNVQGDLI